MESFVACEDGVCYLKFDIRSVEEALEQLDDVFGFVEHTAALITGFLELVSTDTVPGFTVHAVQFFLGTQARIFRGSPGPQFHSLSRSVILFLETSDRVITYRFLQSFSLDLFE